MKRLSLIAALLAFPLALWMGSIALPTLAEDSTDTDVESTADLACATAVAETGQVMLEDYSNFLNEYFQSTDIPTSEQVEVAMDYYRFVEDSLLTSYNENAYFSDFQSGDDLETLRYSSYYCDQALGQYLEINGMLLQDYAIKTAGGKQAIQALDAMSILNEHLGELEVNFLDTFPGSFNQMNNALPCFAKACIGS